MRALEYLFTIIVVVAGLNSCANQKPAATNQEGTAVQDSPKSVSVRGEEMHYLEEGSGEPVILVHGAIGDYNAWSQQMAALSENHRVIAISRRYAWPNQQPDRDESFDCTVALHSKDLIAFMEALQIQSAHVIGHSYGAMIALRTAIDRPETVKSLVLGEPAVESIIEGTATADSLINDFRNLSTLAGEHYRAGRDEQAMRTFIKMVLGSDEVYDAAPQEWRDSWFQNMVEGICIAETQDMASLARQELQELEVPTLLIKGEYSPAILRMVSDSLDAVLPNSELEVLPRSSHGLQGENPAVFNALVLSFLNNSN